MQAGTAGGGSDKVALYCMLHINTDKRRSSTLLHWQILHIKHFTLIHRCCWITLVWGEKKNTHTVTKTHFVRLANTIQQQVSGQLEHVIGYNQVTHSQWRGRDNPPHPPSLLSRCNSDVAGGSFFFFWENARYDSHRQMSGSKGSEFTSYETKSQTTDQAGIFTPSSKHGVTFVSTANTEDRVSSWTF